MLPIESLRTGFGSWVGEPTDLVPDEVVELVEDAHQRRAENWDHASMADGGRMLFTPRRFSRTFQCGVESEEVLGGLIKYVDGCGLQFLSEADLDRHQTATDENGRPLCSGSSLCAECQRCFPDRLMHEHIDAVHNERNIGR